jgi:hypothetical protein
MVRKLSVQLRLQVFIETKGMNARRFMGDESGRNQESLFHRLGMMTVWTMPLIGHHSSQLGKKRHN